MARVPESTPPAPPPRLRQKPRYAISHHGGRTSVEVDGVPVRHLVAVNVELEPRALPRLDLTLSPLGNVIALDDAQLAVDVVDLPEPVARALYEHLRAKYQGGHDDAALLHPREKK